MKGDKAEFSHELIASARTYLNKQAIYHQDFAGNCIEWPSDQCLRNGIGPRVFDCSGLVLRAIGDTLGIDVILQAEKPRHVRDMWRSAREQDDFTMTNLAIGALVVLRRDYTIRTKQVAFLLISG